MITSGTQIANQFLKKALKSSWGNPSISTVDNATGSTMPGEGQLLYGFVRALKPETILEVGTSYGGSTLHLAAGCKDNDFGKVYTVEIDPYRQSQAKYYAQLAGVENWIEFYNSIPDLSQFDFVFLDAEHTTKAVAQYLIDIKKKLSKKRFSACS